MNDAFKRKVTKLAAKGTSFEGVKPSRIKRNVRLSTNRPVYVADLQNIVDEDCEYEMTERITTKLNQSVNDAVERFFKRYPNL